MKSWRPTWRDRDITSIGATCWCSKARLTCRSAAKPRPMTGTPLALTFAQPVVPAEVEEPDEEEGFGGGYHG
jgi:hypothetical protein